MQDFTDLAFLATYATLSLAAFAVLQHIVVPYGEVVSDGKFGSRHRDE